MDDDASSLETLCNTKSIYISQQKIIGYHNPNFWVKITATEVIHFLGYGYQYSVSCCFDYINYRLL